jgi:hypothetical protein
MDWEIVWTVLNSKLISEMRENGSVVFLLYLLSFVSLSTMK